MGRGAGLGAGVVCLIVASAIWQISRDARVPIPASYDYNEGVYAATADASAHGSHLYRDVFVAQPPILILMIRGAFRLLGTSLVAARSTIVFASAVWLTAILAALWVRGSAWSGALAVCLLLGSATFLTQAHTVDTEVPSEALACAAIALAARRDRHAELPRWVAIGALAGLAVMTRLTAVTCLVPLAGATIDKHRPAMGKRWATLAAGVVIAVSVLLPVIGTAGFLAQVFTFHVALLRLHPESRLDHAAMIGRFLVREWPLSVAAALGLRWSLKRGGWLDRAFIAWLMIDCAFLIVLTPLWERHLIILFSPLAFLAGTAANPAVVAVARRSTALRPAAGIALAAGMISIVLGASAVPPPASSVDLARVVSRISRTVPPAGKVLTDDPMVPFLAGRSLAAGLIDTSLARIWAGEIIESRLETILRGEDTEAVVFWRGTFRHYFPQLEPLAADLYTVEVRAPGERSFLVKRPDLRPGR